MFVHLDPRAAEVQVPEWFKKQPQLVLQIGLNMPVPIPDLHLDDQKMSCTLSFNRSPFLCVVPWAAVFAMVDEEGRAMVWPEDVPPEVQAQARDRGPASTDNVREVRPASPRAGAGGATAAAKGNATKGSMRPTPLEAVKSVGSGKGDGTARKPKGDGKTKGGKARADSGRVVELRSAAPTGGTKDGTPGRNGPALVPPARPSTARLDETRDGDALRRALEGGSPPPAEADSPSAPELPASPAPPKRSGAGKPARKTKREIPPYLRVVK